MLTLWVCTLLVVGRMDDNRRGKGKGGEYVC